MLGKFQTINYPSKAFGLPWKLLEAFPCVNFAIIFGLSYNSLDHELKHFARYVNMGNCFPAVVSQFI